MNVAHWLQRAANIYPDNPALLRGTKVVANYREFARRAKALAAALAENFNVRPGDRVSLVAKNHTRYLEVMYAIWFAGAIVVPINAKLHPREVAWILENSDSNLVFTDTAHLDEISEVLPSCVDNIVDIESPQYGKLRQAEPLEEPVTRALDDTAWLFYTSGTTGRPKGVMITHGNIQAMVFSYLSDVDEVSADDAALMQRQFLMGQGFIISSMLSRRRAMWCRYLAVLIRRKFCRLHPGLARFTSLPHPPW